jgi:hypothetical protein
MKKLFGLFLLGAALMPFKAEAANRFWVGGSGTWDNTSTTNWSTSSGGASGASAPTSSDAVIFDTASPSGGVGGPTFTVTTFAGTISAQSITWGTCTASTTGCIIDASVNNTNFTLANSTGTIFSGTGTGTRKWLGGTGTYTITRSSSAVSFSMLTTTNDQGSIFSGATWIFSGTTGNGSSLLLGSFSYGPMTLNANTSGGSYTITGTNTFASLTINSPNFVLITGGVTSTITGALTLTGSSATSTVYFASNQNDPAAGAATISIGSASTGNWNLLRNIITSGAAAFTASNCIGTGTITLANGGACNAPSGGGGGRIIGG